MEKIAWGGKRRGAGRKGYGEPTKQVVVPVSLVPIMKDIMADIIQFRQKLPEKGMDTLLPAVNPVKMYVPVLGHSVPAGFGFPSSFDDYAESHLDLNEYFVSSPASTFYMKVTGDSMNKAGILEGCMLGVDRSLEPAHNDIVIAVVNNEYTVKRLYNKNGKTELHPESDNTHHRIRVFQHYDDLAILGVVTSVHHKIK